MRHILITIFTLLTFTGCLAKDYAQGTETMMVDNVRLYSHNKIMSIEAPFNLGEPFKGFSTSYKDFLSLTRFIRGRMVEKVLINNYYISPEGDIFNSFQYLDKKNGDIFEQNVQTNKNTIYYNEKYGIKYYEGSVDYIDGIRCRSFSQKEKYREDYDHKITINIQTYDTFCSYYDLSGKGRLLWITYEYNYSFGSQALKGLDENLKSQSLKDIQHQFKQDIKTIFDSLQIHDMDRAKMKELGLLHNKAYEIKRE